MGLSPPPRLHRRKTIPSFSSTPGLRQEGEKKSIIIFSLKANIRGYLCCRPWITNPSIRCSATAPSAASSATSRISRSTVSPSSTHPASTGLRRDPSSLPKPRAPGSSACCSHLLAVRTRCTRCARGNAGS